MTEKHDYDTPWKEVIETYFPEFVAFFFPEAYRDIDWEKGYEFLDKELQQIAKDAETGRKYVDKLAKVRLKSGEDVWALVHADIQIEAEKDFSERMYMYNYRLYDKFRRHAASFAVIGYAGKKKDTGKFEKELWGCKISFRFPVARLKDYEKDQEALKNSSNPFAVAVLAYLKTRETAKNSKKRMREKIALIRHLYEKGFSKQEIVNFFRFIDWIMFLPKAEDALFWEEVSVFEKEGKMPYITSVERIGMVKQGRAMLARQIARKFRSQPNTEIPELEKLGADDLLELGEQIFDFESLDQVRRWTEQRAAQKHGDN